MSAKRSERGRPSSKDRQWHLERPGTEGDHVTPTMIDRIKLKRAEDVKKCSVDRNRQVLRRFFNTKRLRYLTEEQFKRPLDASATRRDRA